MVRIKVKNDSFIYRKKVQISAKTDMFTNILIIKYILN